MDFLLWLHKQPQAHPGRTSADCSHSELESSRERALQRAHLMLRWLLQKSFATSAPPPNGSRSIICMNSDDERTITQSQTCDLTHR